MQATLRLGDAEHCVVDAPVAVGMHDDGFGHDSFDFIRHDAKLPAFNAKTCLVVEEV